jgi:catechol 2,3-dioxygenase-like lactoylglutathione lyase family enzyme
MKITETNVTIMVMDMDRSIKFYEQIGLTLKQRWDDNYAMLTTAGLTIGIHPGGRAGLASSHVSIGFMIESAEEGKALLEKYNIAYTYQDDQSGILLSFHDPDGTFLYFMEPRWK